MATSLTPLKRKAIYKQGSVLSWMNSSSSKGAGLMVSAVGLNLLLPCLSLGFLNMAAIYLSHRYSEAVVPSRLTKWHKCYADEVRFFGLSMLWCLAVVLLVLGRCPKNPSSVSKKILLLFKSSTAATFHLFPPRILVYFSKLLNCKLWCCNIRPGFLV